MCESELTNVSASEADLQALQEEVESDEDNTEVEENIDTTRKKVSIHSMNSNSDLCTKEIILCCSMKYSPIRIGWNPAALLDFDCWLARNSQENRCNMHPFSHKGLLIVYQSTNLSSEHSQGLCNVSVLIESPVFWSHCLCWSISFPLSICTNIIKQLPNVAIILLE